LVIADSYHCLANSSTLKDIKMNELAYKGLGIGWQADSRVASLVDMLLGTLVSKIFASRQTGMQEGECKLATLRF
jgi:hypothetical protein